MKKIYIDSTLKNEWNVKFNPSLCSALEERGFSCYLPQRDTNQLDREKIFDSNKDAIKAADVITAIANNESPNWGVEVGYAFGLQKRIVAVAATGHKIPLMAKHIVNTSPH